MPQKELNFPDQNDKDQDLKNCPNCGNINTMVEMGKVTGGYIKYMCNNCYHKKFEANNDT